jgi:hypothetical protein
MLKRVERPLILGLSLAILGSVSEMALAQREDMTGPSVLKYSNLRYSPSRGGLVGASVRLVREDGTLAGTYTEFTGSTTGEEYPLRGTMSDGRISFATRSGTKAIRFQGRVNGRSLVGVLTTVRPDGSKEQSGFKAQRVSGG